MERFEPKFRCPFLVFVLHSPCFGKVLNPAILTVKFYYFQMGQNGIGLRIVLVWPVM